MKRLLLFAMAMFATLASWALTPVPIDPVTEIADEAALKTFITTGGQGKLTADITIKQWDQWYLTADATLDLNNHMVTAMSTTVYGDFCLTIMDSNKENPTTRYWKLNVFDQWESSETETEYTTEGGVVVIQIHSRKFALKSGNVCLKYVQTGDFNISGGNMKFINGPAMGCSYETADCNGIMTGGTISYCYSAIVFPKVTLLGGTITKNGLVGDNKWCVGVEELTLGGTIRIEDNHCSKAQDAAYCKTQGSLTLSSETPLTTGARIGLTLLDDEKNVIAGTVFEGATDYTEYFYSSDANFIMNYDAEGQKTQLVARQMTQPTAEEPTFTVDETDCSASDVTYQWYAKGIKKLTKEDVIMCDGGTWNGTKMSSVEMGEGVNGIVIAVKLSGAVTITFDEVPGELTSIQFGPVFTPTSDPKVFTTNTVDYYGYNMIDVGSTSPFTVTLEMETNISIEGQTTNTLTATADGTYVCGATIRGQEVISAPIAISLGTPTAAEAPAAPKAPKAIKTIENGRIVITSNGKKFDVNGRKL